MRRPKVMTDFTFGDVEPGHRREKGDNVYV